MRVGVLAVGLWGGVRPPAGCGRDAGRGAAAMRGGVRKRQNVAVWRGAAAGGPRARCGVRKRQNVHHLGGVDAYITYIISSRDKPYKEFARLADRIRLHTSPCMSMYNSIYNMGSRIF
jgi:hypothetical protein